LLFAIIGPNRPVQQIYLFDFNGKVFGTGTDNRQQNMSVRKKPWYNNVMNNNGKKYLSIPMKDLELSKYVTSNKDLYYVSLCRIYFDYYNIPNGIVEVKQYYDEIFKSLNESQQSETNEANVYVYNSDGTIIYPLIDNPSKNDAYYFNLCHSTSSEKSSISANNPFTKEKELLNYTYSDFTGWTTVVVESEQKLLSPVFSFTRIVMLFTGVILLLALGFSFFAAKKITVPISKLRKAIKALNLESISTSTPEALISDLNELEDLNQAFHKMNLKVKKSLDDLILSQNHEMQSRMLALQSQMNPHFLYNTLNTISVMAEEAMDNQIIKMCSNVSSLLRYISSDKSPIVKLSTEIEYTEKYLECMKLRYGNKFSYSIEFDEGIKEINIPKLVIQPLVENALKYGTNREPPWFIRISGYRTNTYWQVDVQDNGPGFDPEGLKYLLEKIEQIDNSGLLPSLDLDGMGLLNIYMRLKLSYKNQMIFQIKDYITGGAIITIGGSL
jgi:two-component system, sensor histidine kinase YesM